MTVILNGEPFLTNGVYVILEGVKKRERERLRKRKERAVVNLKPQKNISGSSRWRGKASSTLSSLYLRNPLDTKEKYGQCQASLKICMWISLCRAFPPSCINVHRSPVQL